MKTVNNITPLSPLLPSGSRVREIPSRKRRRQQPPAPREDTDGDEVEEQDDDRPHIDEYA